MQVDKDSIIPTEAHEKPCEHDWQRFKERILPDNPKFHRSAYFVVRACLKCKTKARLDLIIE